MPPARHPPRATRRAARGRRARTRRLRSGRRALRAPLRPSAPRARRAPRRRDERGRGCAWAADASLPSGRRSSQRARPLFVAERQSVRPASVRNFVRTDPPARPNKRRPRPRGAWKMKKAALAAAAVSVAGLAALAAAVVGSGPSAGTASSHREAPLIAEDPSADNTDLYAFRSPDKPSTVTIVANWIPGEDPAAGPNYYTFSPSAKYKLNIDRTGDARPDLVYEFRFGRSAGPAFLGNTVQSWSMWRNKKLVARGKTPPNNIGPRSTPNYRALAAKAVVEQGGLSIFAGQRDDAFYGDIGSIFDLVGFRKGTGDKGGGKDFFAGYAVHAIALQIPISELRAKNSTIGVWASTERQNVTVGGKLRRGWTQVSRLGNPLVNEVVVPTPFKDAWNRSAPVNDKQYAGPVVKPVLAKLMNDLYKLNAPEDNRDDLVAVFGTGIKGLNFTGNTVADMLRLNYSIPVTQPGKVSRLGVIGGDNGGFPNGRRLGDDVIDIAEQVMAGFLKGNKVPLGDGVNGGDVPALDSFPYETDPPQGFANSKGLQKP